MNAVDEIAIEAFLSSRIGFTMIIEVMFGAMLRTQRSMKARRNHV